MSFIVALVYIAIGVLLSLHSWLTLYMTLYAYGEEDYERETGSPAPPHAPQNEGFTILLPCRQEEKVIAGTLRKLANVKYRKSKLEILVLCTPDDEATIKVASEAIRKYHMSHFARIVTFDLPAGKTRALNIGLSMARFKYIAVVDAEDDVSHDFFTRVNAIFASEKVDVVQGAVALMNRRDKWFSLHNTVEYYFWYKYRLYYLAKLGVAPLGGNTVVFHKKDIQEIGGWDESCLTEDADIGIRLSMAGKKIRLLYVPSLITLEETPNSLGAFIRQRTRWNQGFLQILGKGSTSKLRTLRQRLVIWYTLSAPIFVGIFVLLAPVFVIINNILRVSFWSWLPLLVPLALLIIVLIMNCIGLAGFSKDMKRHTPLRSYLFMIVTFIPYQLVLSVAVGRALIRQMLGIFNWEKTVHVGLHRKGRSAT